MILERVSGAGAAPVPRWVGWWTRHRGPNTQRARTALCQSAVRFAGVHDIHSRCILAESAL